MLCIFKIYTILQELSSKKKEPWKSSSICIKLCGKAMQYFITTFLYLLPSFSELMGFANKMLGQFTFSSLFLSLPNTTSPIHSKSLSQFLSSNNSSDICIYFHLDFSPILHSCFPHIVPIHLFFLVGTTDEVVILANI